MGTVAEDQAQKHHQAQDGPRGEDLGPVGHLTLTSNCAS